MSNWKHVTLVVFILIGGTMSFAFWFQYQFNSTLNNFGTTITTNALSVFSSLEKDTKSASTSEEAMLETTLTVTTATTTTSTSSPQAIQPVTDTIIDLKLSFTFPENGGEVYIGCTYPISWHSSTTINSLETALVDAGMREVSEPIASGLARKYEIKPDDPQILDWKVGFVWPGVYYIKISKINGVEAEFRSKVFEINKMSENISTSEKENICKGSGGSF